jgi:hypothetical protein
MHDDQQQAGTVSRQVAGISGEGFRHVALLAGSQEQYLAEMTGFVRAALARMSRCWSRCPRSGPGRCGRPWAPTPGR